MLKELQVQQVAALNETVCVGRVQKRQWTLTVNVPFLFPSLLLVHELEEQEHELEEQEHELELEEQEKEQESAPVSNNHVAVQGMF